MRDRIRSIAKVVLTALLGERKLGSFEYYIDPSLKERWGSAFNGQEFRQKIFVELLKNIEFNAIVETGTFRGSSTNFMHQSSNLPVYTVESHPRYYNYSKTRFKKYPEIKVFFDDSRSFLKKLTVVAELKNAKLFFYLDAHWYNDLPLKEELNIIYNTWDNAVVMIDDFKVPDDPGYGYDDYGPEKTLSIELVDSISDFKLTKFFPTTRAMNETGARRGCVILAKNDDVIDKLSTINLLRIYEPLLTHN